MKFWISLLLVSHITFGSSTMVGQDTSRVNQSDSLLKVKLHNYLDKISSKDFSGTVFIASKGRPILVKGYGQSNRQNQISNTAGTVYDIGSLTKQFTAAAILKLEMQGKLSVSDDITDYLPEFKELDKTISLHHLLTHTGGFPDAMGDDYEEISEEAFIRKTIARVNAGPTPHPYHYSNVGYSLLAIIIERVSGSEYEEFLSEYIFKPAAMSQTGYYLPSWQEEMIATGYQGKKPWGRPLDKNWSEKGPYLHLKGNGGILSTAGDLYKWHLALNGDSILSVSAKAKYFKRHVPETPEKISYYGYGWVIFPNLKQGELITHNGGNGVFYADFWTFPDTDNTVIVLSNAYNRITEDLAGRLSKML